MRSTVPSTWLLLVPLLAGAPLHARAAPAAGTAAEAITAAVLISEGLDAAALREALALRLPGVRVGDASAACEPGCVLVRARRGETGAAELTVWLGDGRSFTRALSPQLDQSERAVATSLAHLLAAIEDGTATPAAIADPPPRPLPAAPSRPEPMVNRTSTREPQPPAPVITGPAPPTSEPRRAAPAPDVPTPAPLPRLEFGPALGLVSVFGVGQPRGLAGSVGHGLVLDLELRGPRGLLVGLGTRVLQARDSGFRLQRVRLALAAGYGLRRGVFELRALAAVSVEPWWAVARADGTRRDGGTPLLGGAVMLAPGVAARLSPTLLAHVGLRLEAAASVGARTGGALQANDPAGMPLFRLGGFELAALVEIGLRWQMTPRRATR